MTRLNRLHFVLLLLTTIASALCAIVLIVQALVHQSFDRIDTILLLVVLSSVLSMEADAMSDRLRRDR